MRRVLALLAAAAMVAGSVAIRSRLDDDEATASLRIVCAVELGVVCDRLRGSAGVTVEPAPATADRLAIAEDPAIDGWLAPAPWPEIVDIRRRQRALLPLFPDTGPVLGRSRLVLVVQRGLLARCAGATEWKCLGEQAAAGQARPSHASLRTSGLGLLVVGQATAAFFGRGDLSTLDLDDPEFARWLRALELAAPPSLSGASPLDEMLGTNFAAYNAVGTVEAEAGPVVTASAIQERVELLYPAPMATADVVLAGVGDGARRLRDPARRALAEAGWRTDGAGLPPTNGLPSPGFLDALRSRALELR
jgi:hypothetical protein